jgi:ubiquinone/menaquinone biosynthesis C-methylase UbiE
VIQHFSQAETVYSFKEISRILKEEGIYLVVFKRKLDNYTAFSKKSGLKINVLNITEGMIEIEDKTMKKAIEAMAPSKKSLLPEKEQSGMRLFHFFSVQEIEKMAKQVNLHIIDNMVLSDGDKAKGIFTYNSGKDIPMATLFFQKR